MFGGDRVGFPKGFLVGQGTLDHFEFHGEKGLWLGLEGTCDEGYVSRSDRLVRFGRRNGRKAGSAGCGPSGVVPLKRNRSNLKMR